jgi:hypothetical protein
VSALERAADLWSVAGYWSPTHERFVHWGDFEKVRRNRRVREPRFSGIAAWLPPLPGRRT